MKQGQRCIASGTSTLPAKSSAAISAMTRNPGERVSLFCFVTDCVPGIAFGALTADGVHLWLERTVLPDQFVLMASNGDKHAARTVEWCVTGVVPA